MTSQRSRLLQSLFADPGLPAATPTKSFWQEPYGRELATIKSKDLPRETDVVIIGSGITACSVARTLLHNDPHISITILEARGLCSGATGMNGGHIRCHAVMDYDRLSREFGARAAEKMAARGLNAEDRNAAEVRRVKSVAVILDRGKAEEVKRAYEAFWAAFPEWKDLFRVVDGEDTEMNEAGVRDVAAHLIGPAGAAWPYRLIHGLFRRMLDLYPDRLAIETYTPAVSVVRPSRRESIYRVVTKRGSIRSRHVLHCTEGHATHLLPQLRGYLWPRRGQMTVQTSGNILPDPGQRHSWSFYFANGFDYMNQNNRTGDLFLGGGDVANEAENFARFANPSDDEESLLSKAHLIGVLPSLFGRPGSENPKLTASWTGIMASSLDGLPFVGRLPPSAVEGGEHGDRRGEWVCAGYGGYGMVNAWMCGKALATAIIDGTPPDWLPEQFLLSDKRMNQLRARLEEVTKSWSGLRALL